MKIGKWIGGHVGYMTMGPLGALAGFALGSLLAYFTATVTEAGTPDSAPYAGQRYSLLFLQPVMAWYNPR